MQSFLLKIFLNAPNKMEPGLKCVLYLQLRPSMLDLQQFGSEPSCMVSMVGELVKII